MAETAIHPTEGPDNITPIRRPASELPSPEVDSDMDFIAFHLSRWKHPAFKPNLAHTILDDFGYKLSKPNEWQRRLATLVKSSPLDELFDDLSETDEIIHLLVERIRQSTAKARDTVDERTAANLLLELRAVEVDPNPFRARNVQSDSSESWHMIIDRLLPEAQSQ